MSKFKFKISYLKYHGSLFNYFSEQNFICVEKDSKSIDTILFSCFSAALRVVIDSPFSCFFFCMHEIQFC